MKTIAEFDDWFPGFINPCDYIDAKISIEDASSKLARHIKQTIPYFAELTENEELAELREQLTGDCRNFIEAVKENGIQAAGTQQDFLFLKETVLQLRMLAIDHMDKNFDALTKTDRFLQYTKQYFNNKLRSLDEEQKKALKRSYVILRADELSFDLVYQLPDYPSKYQGVEQQLDEIYFKNQQCKFLNKILTLVFDSDTYKEAFMADFKRHFLEFCQFLEQNQIALLYQDGYLLEACQEMLAICLEELIKIEKLRNKNRLYELELEGIAKKQLLKQRNEASLQMLRSRQQVIKKCLSNNQQEINQLLEGINAGAQLLYKRIIRLPQREKFEEVAACFGLEEKDLTQDLSPRSVPLWGLPLKLFSAFSELASKHLPTQEAFKCAMMGAAAGLVLGPLGMAVGIGAGMAVAAGGKVAAAGIKRLSEIPLEVQRAFYGKFFVRYQGDAFAITPALKKICDFGDTRAALINSFYAQQIFDLELQCSLLDEGSAPALFALKNSILDHYGKLRKGHTTKEAFWRTIWPEDIRLLLSNYYAEYSEGLALYLQSLQETFEARPKPAGHPQPRRHLKTSDPKQAVLATVPAERQISSAAPKISDQSPYHSQKVVRSTITQHYLLEGINQKLDHLMQLGQWLADPHLEERREENMEVFRELTHSPFERTFEEQVNQLMRHRSPRHLLMWLEEGGFSQVAGQPQALAKLLNQGLPTFQGKTLWHLLCDLPQGVECFSQILACLQHPALPQANYFQRGIKKIKNMFFKWHFGRYFDTATTYEGLNALAYALETNIPLARLYLEQLAKDQASLPPLAKQQLFAFLADEDGRRFYEGLLEGIKLACPSSVGLFCYFYKHHDFSFELMSALAIRLARKEGIPQNSEQVEQFLLELQKKPSAYVTISPLKKLDKQAILQIANRVYPLQKRLDGVVEEGTERPALVSGGAPVVPALEHHRGKRGSSRRDKGTEVMHYPQVRFGRQ